MSANGAQQIASQPVGTVTLTPVDGTDFMFSWHLYGAGGSERFTRLAPSACLPFDGHDANFSGQWYAPAQPGYGMDVLALPGQQFDAFYFYDALGMPRWVAGGAGPFVRDTVLNMTQFSGFCPTCAWAPVAARMIGTLDVRFDDALHGHIATQLALAPPLSGTWNVDRPIARLTGNPVCGP